MKRFKDLFISCSKDQAQAFFSRLTSYLSSSCPDGWQIDDDRMKRFADGICFVSGLFSCVVRFDGNKNPYAMVSLVYSEDEHRIWISNIVPCQTSQLSMDEYNEVLVKFASEIVDPVKLDLTCVITKDEFTGKDVMPVYPPAEKKLVASGTGFSGKNRPVLHRFPENCTTHQKSGS